MLLPADRLIGEPLSPLPKSLAGSFALFSAMSCSPGVAVNREHVVFYVFMTGYAAFLASEPGKAYEK